MAKSQEKSDIVSRDVLWRHKLDARFNVIYLKALRDRYDRRDKIMRCIIAITTSSTVISWGFWSSIPIVWQSISVLSTVLAIISAILKYPELAATMCSLYGQMMRVQSDVDKLWDRMESGVTVTIAELEQAAGDENSYDKSVEIPKNIKLNKKTRNEVLREVGFSVQGV